MSTESEDTDSLRSVAVKREHRKNQLFRALTFFASILGLLALAFLIADVLWEAGRAVLVFDTEIGQFLTQAGSTQADQAGFVAAMIGSVWLMLLTALFALFVGVGAAIYLEEYAPDNWVTRLIEANLANLAAVPSVVYGLVVLGLLIDGGPGLDRVILAGGVALALVVMPIIIVSSIEALRAVPDSLRAGSRAAGATKWQTIRTVVLPAATPGIMTGTILALAQAIGQTAPLLMVGALIGGRHIPLGPFDSLTAMTVTIFEWAFLFDDHFHALAALGIVVLLAIMLAMNAVAIYIRNRFEREL